VNVNSPNGMRMYVLERERVALRRFAGLLWLGTLFVLTTLAFSQTTTESARELAMFFARNGVPAGFVLPAAELAAVRAPSHQAATLQGEGETLRTILSRFNDTHASLRASVRAGMVHVRGTKEPATVRESLERTVYVPPPDGVTAFDAVFIHVVGLLAGREPQGIVGSIVTTEESDCRVTGSLRLGGEGTVVSVLDAIVRQSPGLVWLVTYDPAFPAETMQVGLMCPDGSVLSADVNF
jgi:hypothetical protein